MPGTWQPLTHQPTFNTSTSILLSDGRIMFQEEATNHWHALTPDKHGSYVDGTWSALADMSFWRRYYPSGMLKDGRIVLIGVALRRRSLAPAAKNASQIIGIS
jgi:hypothetical protein